MSEEALFNTQAIQNEVAKVEQSLDKLSRNIKALNAVKVDAIQRELASLAENGDKSVKKMAKGIKSALDEALQIQKGYADGSLNVTKAAYSSMLREAKDAIAATAVLEKEGYVQRLAMQKAANDAKIAAAQAASAKVDAIRKVNDSKERESDLRRIKGTLDLQAARNAGLSFSNYDASKVRTAGTVVNRVDESTATRVRQATIGAGGDYTSLASGRLMRIQNAELMMNMPSKEDFLVAAAKTAAEAARIAKAATVQAKAATLNAVGDYSSMSSGRLMRIKNAELMMNMPSKEDFLAASAKVAAEASAAAARARSMVAAATNATSGTYQAYNPSTQTSGSLQNVKELSTSFRKLAVDGSDVHSMARGLASGFNLLWLTWGNLAPLFAGAAISFGIKGIVELGAQVQNTMETIRVLSVESADSVQKLNVQMLDLAKNGPYGPLEIAKAMKTLSLAGLNAGKVGTAIKDVLNFAVAGDTSIEKAADVMTTVATAFGVAAEGYNYVGDVIAKTAAVSKSSVESIGEAFKTSSVLGKQYGITLEDVGVGLAALAAVGIQGTAAGTALRNMYVDLSGRTPKVSKALKEMGLELRDTNGRFKDIVTMTMEFNTAIESIDNNISQKKFLQDVLSERGGKPIIELRDLAIRASKETGDTVRSELQKLKDDILNSAGFMVMASAQMALTPLNQMKSVVSTLQATMVEAFDGLAPVITNVSSKLKEIFSSPEFSTGLQNMMGNVAKLSVALVENLDVIGKLAIAFVAFKAFQMTGSVFAMIAAQAATATTAVTGLGVAMTGVVSAQTLSSMAAAGVWLGRIVSWVVPIVRVVTAAALAWQMYDFFMGKSNKTVELASGSGYHDQLISKLRSETARLNENTEAMRANMSVEDLRNKKAGVDLARKRTEESDGNIAIARSRANSAAQALALSEKQDKNPAAVNNYTQKRTGTNTARADKEAADKALVTAIEKKRIDDLDLIHVGALTNAAAAKNAYDVKKKMEDDRKAAEVTGGTSYGGHGSGKGKTDKSAASEAKAELKSEVDSKIQMYKNMDKAILDGRKDASDELAQLQKLDQVTANEVSARTIENERAVMLARVAIIDREIAAIREKKNSDKEEEAAVGRREDAIRDFLSLQKKELREIEVANYQKAKSFREATEAANEYIATMVKQASREVAGMGKGERGRGFNSGLQQIEDKYSSQSTAALKDYRKDEDRSSYDLALERIRYYQEAEIAIYRDKYAKLEEMRSRADLGALEALQNYKDNTQDVYGQVNSIVGKSLQGVEDNLTSLVMTGKADFKGFAASILSDITRMIIKQQIFNALVSAQSSGAGGGILKTLFGAIAGAVIPGAAPAVGPVADYTFGNVVGNVITSAKGNVYNTPNLSSYSGSIVDKPTYFAKGGNVMGEAGPEAIMPLTRGANGKLGVQSNGARGGASGEISIMVNVDATGTKTEGNNDNGKQLGDMIGSAVRAIIISEKRPGGMLYANA